MKQYQAESIVLAVKDWGGADKITTLFSRDYGKLTAVAYGARQPKSRLAGSIQLFSHIDVTLTPGKNLDTLKQCELKNSFRSVREELTTMAYAALVTELTAELWPEREAQPEVFDLLLAVLHLFTVRNPRIVALACSWQLLSLAGYCPECEKCIICGRELSVSSAFDVRAGGGVCGSCRRSDHLVFDDAIRQFLERLLHLNFHDPDHFSTSSQVVAQTEFLLSHYLTQHLDKPLRSLSFIRSISPGISG